MTNLEGARKITWAKVMSGTMIEKLGDLLKSFEDNLTAINDIMNSIRDNYDGEEFDVNEEQLKAIEELNTNTFKLMVKAIDTVEGTTIRTMERLYENK